MSIEIPKTPAEILVRGFDWSKKLAELGGAPTITISSWTQPAGITIQNQGVSGGITKIQVSGGTIDNAYVTTNTVTLSDGRVLERSLTFRVYEHIFVRV